MDIKITLDVTDRLLEVLERLSRFGQVNFPSAAPKGDFPVTDLRPQVAMINKTVKELAEVTDTPVRTETTEERDERVKESMFTAVKEYSPPADVTHLPEAPVKRRRTKAQITEDRENGLEDRFKQLSKEFPDASVDDIREKMYAELTAAEPADDSPAAETPDEPSSDDDWVPNWT